ncbi:uncharacterized protein TNCV_3033291 [Trichonephila clavipes]|nr:uncharacterized protein TNCV_3033291 [Trichonephila clavipes]
MYEDFVQEYTKNEESKNFVEYFVKSYGGRKQKWAYCYRVRLEINTNMKLVSWNRELKYEEGGEYDMRQGNGDKWIVYKTVTNGVNTYEVNKVKDCDCPIRCHKCQICIHSLTCNCVETVLLVDEDSNRLRREKEAILKEKEKSVVHEEPTELVCDQV